MYLVSKLLCLFSKVLSALFALFDRSCSFDNSFSLPGVYWHGLHCWSARGCDRRRDICPVRDNSLPYQAGNLPGCIQLREHQEFPNWQGEVRKLFILIKKAGSLNQFLEPSQEREGSKVRKSKMITVIYGQIDPDCFTSPSVFAVMLQSRTVCGTV